MAVALTGKRPLIRWIVLIGVLTSVPVAIAVAQWFHHSMLNDLSDRAQDELKVQLAYLQSRIESLQTITRIVGADERITSVLVEPGDKTRFDEANQYLSRLYVTSGSIAYVLNLKGRVLASGNWDAEDSFVGWNLSMRPYFQRAALGETAHYVALGVVSRRLGFFVAVPIYLGGEVLGVAVTKTDPQTLVLPEERSTPPFIITDKSGVAIISRPKHYLLHTLNGPANLKPHSSEHSQRFPDVEIRAITREPIEYRQRVRMITPAMVKDSGLAPAKYVLEETKVAGLEWTAYILWPIQGLKTILVQRVALTLLIMAVAWLCAVFLIERWRNMKQMQQHAFRDPLTRLYTRLYMMESATSLLAAHDRRSIPGVSAVMFDLDHFKAINDQYGHSAGDDVLTHVADVLIRECRESDIPIRYGGEEFLIFVPNRESGQVLQLAERVRRQIKTLEIHLSGKTIRLTISGGIATHRRGEPLERLIDRADQRMYAAKQAGRDRVISEPVGTEAHAIS